MSKSNFFALINRMKYIKRWSLMRNSVDENLLEHAAQVSIIAHALAIIRNEKFGGCVDVNKVAAVALYHDTSEVLTGDMPTPIKYNNPKIKEAYKDMEGLAEQKLISMLPLYLKPHYENMLHCDDLQIRELVKAADRLSAYIKCIEELACGNNEFSIAKETIEKTLIESKVPEIQFFLDNFIDGYNQPLDSL